MTDSSPDLNRRTILRGVAVGGVALPLLAACSGGDAAGSSSGAGASSGSGGSGGSATVSTGDVPVGGGTILADQQVVVTQPSRGDFKAFSAICTHQGCTLTKVENGMIICPCHGSTFSIKDGSPTGGPAPSALAPKKVSVKGNKISVD